ncbi:MAG: hypothetical protein Q8910_00630 [Bacteroidota bacterium]|nr:hypothetical protein [Bacteroidota bacterium]
MCKKIKRHPQNPNVIVAEYPDGGMRHATKAEIEQWELEQKTLVDKEDYKPTESDLELLAEMEQGSEVVEVAQLKRGRKKSVSI